MTDDEPSAGLDRIQALTDSMKRFDAARGKSVANAPAIENRPLSHDDADKPSSDLLH
jgi:hypothetical protein